VAITILLGVGIAAFFVRKVYKRRRDLKRNTWGAGLVPTLETKRNTIYGDKPHTGVVPSMVQKSLPQPPSSLGFTSVPSLSLPPMSYNASLPTPFTPPSLQASGPQAMSPVVGSAAALPKQEIAVVVRTFIPTLPDELNIANGEHIRVLDAYDDGWALCANIRGEQGVVPLECLQRDGAPAEMQLQPQSEFGYGSDKASKRLSSLAPNTSGVY